MIFKTVILKSYSKVILCSGEFSGNSYPVGKIYRMAEPKVSFDFFFFFSRAKRLFGRGK